jgi:hypothetical protein
MKCSVFIATSLEGFIARNDGAIDWSKQILWLLLLMTMVVTKIKSDKMALHRKEIETKSILLMKSKEYRVWRYYNPQTKSSKSFRDVTLFFQSGILT